jgi:hypothetical protein
MNHKAATKAINDYVDAHISESALPESKDYLALANAAKKKAQSAAKRDEQELHVKHMIVYHTHMAKHEPEKAAAHMDKIGQYKKNIGESADADEAAYKTLSGMYTKARPKLSDHDRDTAYNLLKGLSSEWESSKASTLTKLLGKYLTEADDTPYHRVAVTVSEPDHTMVSKRKETAQKFIRVKGDKADAVAKAKAHFKKKGFKVHGAEYVDGYAIAIESRVDARINDASERGENIPSNIDPKPKKLDPAEAAAKIKKLKARIAVLKVKLAVAKKAPKPDERVILGIENDLDIADGQIEQLSK